ncbi:MAG: BolA/IbaG family iron-sulfur metabolism protein [Gammaproteobacteria bacterium]|nr:BolA/IbaG family iron-sulfur metabolism protein [Gammaproteobacteria bacterium]
MFDKKEIEQALQAAFKDGKVVVEGDDGVHFHATVTSESFRGKTRIQQHQMVYRVLGEKVGNEIHALGLTTKTPETPHDN